MALVPWPTSSAPGVDPHEGSGRLINMYAEKAPSGARSQVTWRRTPGIVQELDVTGEVQCRGIINGDQPGLPDLDAAAYVVFDAEIFSYERDSAGVWTGSSLGSFGTTRPVTLAKNTKNSPDFVVCQPDGGAAVITGAGIANYSGVDSDLPSDVGSVAMLNSYFLFTRPRGEIWSSDLNSTAVASNAFTTADRSPDGLLRGVAFRDRFFAFGPASCQVYRDIGASPFPLEFETVIPRGLKATHAIAGWEEGWANDLIWVADNNQVVRLGAGYEPSVISTSDVSRAIAGSADYRLLEACVYMSGEHSFWELTSPGEFTWVYNKTTGEWSELISNGRNDRRVASSCFLGGEWIVGDRTTGKLGRISSTAYQEFGDTLMAQMDSGPVHQFPGRTQIPRVDFDFTRNTTASTVSISWSNDGGQNYGTAISRDLTGKYVSLLRAGQANPKGARYRWTSSSNAPIAFHGAQAAALARAA